MSEPAARYDITNHADAPEPDLAAYQAGVVELMEAPFPGAGTQLPGTDLAPVEALTGDIITREAQLAMLERQAFDCRNQYLRSRFDLGMVLMEHRRLCDAKTEGEGRRYAGRFDRLVAELGMSSSSAYEHIAVAQTVQQFPALKDLAEGQFKKLVAISEGIDAEQIAQIASGNGPITLDEIDQLSVRKLKARVRELTEDKDKLVKRATAALTAERDALVKERDKLAALTGDSLDSLRDAVYQLDREIDAAVKTLNGIYRQLDALGDVPAAEDKYARKILDQIDARVRLLAKNGPDLWQVWFDRRLLDYGHDGI